MICKGIRYYAETAKSARDRRILGRMADAAEARRAEIESMPEWAKECAVFGDARVPVSAKVEHDGLEVEHWTSKRGARMHRVHWADGWTTQYEGDLSKQYVEWNR